jgi:hypothetical protein
MFEGPLMTKTSPTLSLTALEAKMLSLGAHAGTCDDAIDHLGWQPSEKAAFQRAQSKLQAYRRSLTAPEPGLEQKDPWRELALQFDGQRMMALQVIQKLLQDPAAARAEAEEFLAAAPKTGEDVLAERIAELAGAPEALPTATLERILDAIVDRENERILAMSNEEILAESRARGDDPEAFATKMRAFVKEKMEQMQ